MNGRFLFSLRLGVSAVYSQIRNASHAPRGVIAPSENLQLICKVMKAQAGAKPVKVNLIAPKTA